MYALRDPSTANVSVQVWYDVGSKDDPKGRSGFAHLFEHMMFKSTRNMVSEQFDRLTEDVGGFNNASTWDDFTNYYEVVPANHLERLLWAEAERMGSLVVDDAVFKSERDVVKEEYRQSYMARPYGKLFGLYVTQTAYDVHPYGRPGIGSIEELDAATVDDVRAFHATYYRPDNAILVVSGNFDPAQLDRLVDRYFAPIAHPDRPIPRVTAVEPARTAPRDFVAYEPNTPLPAAALTFPGPAARDPDMPAMLVLDAILSKGESSRLYQSLVYEQQLATQAQTSFGPTKDPGAISLVAIMAEGKTAEQGVAALRAEAARMRDAEVVRGGTRRSQERTGQRCVARARNRRRQGLRPRLRRTGLRFAGSRQHAARRHPGSQRRGRPARRAQIPGRQPARRDPLHGRVGEGWRCRGNTDPDRGHRTYLGPRCAGRGHPRRQSCAGERARAPAGARCARRCRHSRQPASGRWPMACA